MWPIISDNDECTLGTDECNQICSNTDGSYNCFCKTGYELELDGHTCVGKCAINCICSTIGLMLLLYS